ncbi:uncharacterized protein [Hetaerina americana]|uniref:uncharacterized protein n=1 Tax=Hetaerina americana TaxID=62018 RepID=UPI003A7F1BB0
MAANRFSFYLTVVEREGPLIKLWGQLDKNTVEYIDTFIIELEGQLSKGGGKAVLSNLSAGQTCCALYNGIFYRAKILSVANISAGLVVVRFIDYGNSTLTSVENIRPMDEKLGRIPPQATDFYLYGVTPLTETNLGDITTDYMKQQLCYQDFDVYPVIGINDKRLIKLYQNNIDFGELMISQNLALAMDNQHQEALLRGNVMPSLPASIVKPQHWPAQGHTPAQFAQKAPAVQNSMYEMHGMPTGAGRASPHSYGVPQHVMPSPGEISVKTFTSPILEPNSEHNIYVSNVEDGPLSFAVQLQAAEQTLIAVTADIAAHRPIPLREPPVPGSVCLARFPGDTKLSRATIMEVMDSTCRLYYVDFGNISDVPYTDIFELPAKLINPKAMALRFCLAGLKKGPPPTKITKEAFKDIVKGCLLRLRVAPNPEGPPLKQYGYLFREGKDVRILYEELAKEKYRGVSHIPASASYSRATLMYEPAKADAVVDGTWVNISHLNSPDEFWVQLEADQSELDQVMALLDEYCNKTQKIPSISDLTIKSPIFAKFSEDDRWYRASILKVDAGSEGLVVHVEFVDYGNVEGINDISRLRLADPSIVSALAAQAVRCRLNGAASVRYKVGAEVWSQISTMFSDLTLESRGMVKLGPRGVGDPVVVIEELRDDTLSPPVVLTMDVLSKALVGSASKGILEVNSSAVNTNSGGSWHKEKKTVQDYNANSSSSHGDYSGQNRAYDANKAREENTKKSPEDGGSHHERRGRRVGGRNGNQEIGSWDGGDSLKENEGISPPFRRGINSNPSLGGSWSSNKDTTNSSRENGGGFSGGGYPRGGRGGRRSQDSQSWDSRQSDSDGGGDNYHSERGGRRGRWGSSFGSSGRGGGGYRGGRRGGGGYGGRNQEENEDWENKDNSGPSDSDSSIGRGGYRGGRGHWGSDGGDRGSRGGYRGGRGGGWEDKDSFRKRDDDGGFGGGGYRGRRDRDGSNWDGGSRPDWGSRQYGGGRGGGRENRLGSQNDDDNSNSGFGGGGYRGSRGRDEGDRSRRYGGDWNGGYGDSRGGRGGRGGRDSGRDGGRWKDNNSNDTHGKYNGIISSNMVNEGEEWAVQQIPAPPLEPLDPPTTISSGQIEQQSVEAGSVEEVSVVFVESRANFFVQLKSQANKLHVIMNLLSENYSAIDVTAGEKVGTEESAPSNGQVAKAPLISLSTLHVGMPCAALSSEDEVWYRALVEKEPTADVVSICFVDYGNKADLAEGSVRELPNDLCSLPAQAICCSLWGLDECVGDGDEVCDLEFETEVTSGEATYAVSFVKRSIIGGNECVEVVLRNKDTGECVNSRFGGSDQFSVPDDAHTGNTSSHGTQNIPKPDFTLGSTVDVDIVYVASRKEFYCQVRSTADQLSAVMDKLASICVVEGNEGGERGAANKSQTSKAAQISITSVEPGMPCAALFSEDGVWYRAVADGKATDEGLSVKFVDYGNKSNVPEGSLRALPADLRLLPEQAIRCRLFGVSEASEEEDSEMGVEFEILVSSDEASYSATIVKKSLVGQNECMEIILKNKSTLECINSRFGGSDEVSEFFEQSDNKTGSLTGIPKLDFAMGSEVDVDIVHVVSRREFYCQPKESAMELQEVMSKLATVCTTEEEEVAPPCESTLRMFGLRPGMFCAALFAEDSVWYRAQVLHEPKVKETGSGFVVNVKFIDYGNEAEVEESGIKDLIPALTTFPAQAIPCCLLGIMDGFVMDTNKEIEFETAMTDPEISLEALFVAKASGSEHMEVLLKHAGTEDCINQQFGAIDKVTGGNGFGLRAAMPADQRLEVSVIWFVSPFRFYVQPIDWAKDLMVYMDSLQKVTKYSIFPWPPAVGTPVLAQFVQDGGLYRAVVEEIGANSTVKVQYIDYGNRESLTQSQVWTADPCFKNKSPQAIPCALRGVNPIGDGWPFPGHPENSLEKYFFLEKLSCIFHGQVSDESKVCDGIDGESRYWVSISKPDGTSVADELVAAGLATPDDSWATPHPANLVSVSNEVYSHPPRETTSLEAKEEDSVNKDEGENDELREQGDVQCSAKESSHGVAKSGMLEEDGATFPLDKQKGDSSVSEDEANIIVHKSEEVCDSTFVEKEFLPNTVSSEHSCEGVEVEQGPSNSEELEVLGCEKQIVKSSVPVEMAEDQQTRDDVIEENVLGQSSVEEPSEMPGQVKNLDQAVTSVDIKLAVETLSDLRIDILKPEIPEY